MGKYAKRVFTSEIVLSILYRCIRVYSYTFRFKVENEHIWKEHVRDNQSVIICCWHQQFFSAIRHFQSYKQYQPALMISQSTDGEIIAGVAQRTGWQTIRGSSSKNGKQALENMIDWLKTERLVAHIVDGPRGPIGKVKPGVIRMAQEGNAVIVPFYTSAERAWHFKSWDKFFIPKPFSRVRLIFGETFFVKESENESDFEAQRLMLEKIMLKGLIMHRGMKYAD